VPSRQVILTLVKIYLLKPSHKINRTLQGRTGLEEGYAREKLND